jgi:hypothetical protein
MLRELLVRTAALLCAGSLLAGCGGGTSSTTPKTGVTGPVTTQANATGTLTIKYPTGFATVRNGLSSKRHAAYVNPSAGNYINVIIDGTPTPGSPYAVAATPDSTQTITVPFVSTNPKQVGAYEYDGGGEPLAVGITGPNPISAGGTNAVTVTMQMDASRMGVTTDPATGSDALLIDNDQGVATPFCLAGSSAVYPFPADVSGGYVRPGTPAGNGGIPSPSLTSVSSAGTSRFGAEALGYYMSFDGANDPLTAFLSMTNPVPNTGVTAVVQFYQSANCAQPSIVTLPTTLTPPGGYKYNTTPVGLSAWQVVAFGGYTYWAFSNDNNNEEFDIAKYDSQYNLISVTAFGGDRYLASISINTGNSTVTFFGQCGCGGVTLTWAQLTAL